MSPSFTQGGHNQITSENQFVQTVLT